MRCSPRRPTRRCSDLCWEHRVGPDRAGQVVEGGRLVNRDLSDDLDESRWLQPTSIRLSDSVAAQAELAEVGLVVLVGLQLEGRSVRQGLAPQQSVISPKSCTVTVRVVSPCIRPDIETRVDQRRAVHHWIVGRSASEWRHRYERCLSEVFGRHARHISPGDRPGIPFRPRAEFAEQQLQRPPLAAFARSR